MLGELCMVCEPLIACSDHPFSMYAKFSEKLAFLTLCYVHVRMHIREQEMTVFQKGLRT